MTKKDKIKNKASTFQRGINYVSLQTWQVKGFFHDGVCCVDELMVDRSTVTGRTDFAVLPTTVAVVTALTGSVPVGFSLFFAGVTVMLGLLIKEATEGV